MARLRVGQQGFEFWQGQEVYLFSDMFRPTLGPTQPPIECVPDPFPGDKEARV
jgi:hypothetical protein